MAVRGGPRMAVGSAAWIAEERSAALEISKSEIEEFSHSAHNEIDWLNEHMAEIFSENQTRVAELFKTPGKLRGKTPRTAKKINAGECRVPLSDVFSATPYGASNPFSKNLVQPAHTRTPQFKVAEDRPTAPEARPARVANPTKPQDPAPIYPADSGYHGSQDMMDLDESEENMQEDTIVASPRQGVDTANIALTALPRTVRDQRGLTEESLEDYESAKEEQTRPVNDEMMTDVASFDPVHREKDVQSPTTVAPEPAREMQPAPSPEKSPPTKSIARKELPAKATTGKTDAAKGDDRTLPADTVVDDSRSPSDGSSPIRPIIRKSSLNFASLPAREPLTSNKSLGGRMSRTSHLEQTRISYYQRNTGGKSLGTNVRADADRDDNDDHDEMDVDDDMVPFQEGPEPRVVAHNKSYTQRLQDQISKLGKAQPTDHRLSKSIANLVPSQQMGGTSHASQPQQQVLESKTVSTPMSKPSTTTPGAFPGDDDDDWIASPGRAVQPSPRPVMAKSHSADVVEDLAGKQTTANLEFPLPKSRTVSPNKVDAVPDRTTTASAHTKSASVPSLQAMDDDRMDAEATSPKKTISVSNPPLTMVMEDDTKAPPKSPSRNFRDSPLRQVKNKLTSILKSSRGLLVSSAAISAEGKALISPSATRLGLHAGPSVESFKTAENVLYPDLMQHGETESASPSRQASSRKTRASAERERREAKEMEREAKEKEKEAKRMADQMEKLEKAREKEREKARIFSQEQARLADMEKQVAAHKEKELAANKGQGRAEVVEAEARAEAQDTVEGEANARTVPSSPSKSPTRATRTSPRKGKTQQETEAAPPDNNIHDQDVEMADAPSSMAPPPVPPSAMAAAPRGQVPKRPVKPTKELPLKSKQAPTVIRVTPGSQNSQFHPSNSVLAATLQDTLGSQPSQSQPRKPAGKASHNSLQTKPSMQSLNSSTSSGKPRALELAARRKEQEERAAQQKREAKLEMERKRAAMQEAERQKEEERRRAAQAQLQAKKEAQRQAALEKAKQMRAPPSLRSQPSGPPDYNMNRDQASSRPPSRLGSTMQQDSSRPVNTALPNGTVKKASKRPLQQDANDEFSRPPPSRPGTAGYQSKDAGKRIRMTDQFEDDIDMADSQPTIKGPPVRPSGGLKKDMPHKSGFGSSYTTIPQGTRDLFRSTVTAQHNSQKTANPMDMAQISKAAIPFASNPNQAGQSYKTPARPVASALSAKSAAKSSPRLVAPPTAGDLIELPEIQTDDEDEDDTQLGVAPWANSPDLARALMEQEHIDPMEIFGPPAPINMEEVFSKKKNRFQKFRARTSSANWSGADRLTEEDVRKDLRARDKMRREGGWSYEITKDMN